MNHRDIVTRIPPAPLYAHVDLQTKFDRDGDIVEERGLEEDPDELPFTEEAFRELQQELDPDTTDRGLVTRAIGIDDHAMGGYIEKLRKRI